MPFKSFQVLLGALFLASRSYGTPAALENRGSSDFLCTCNDIAEAISSASQVYFPCVSFSHFLFFILMGCQASSEYQLDISHFAPSSSETSVCSVEPGSAEDVGKIVRYLDLTLQHLPTCIFLVTYLGIKRNALCGERWRTCRESGIFLDSRRTDRDDTLQRDKG